MTAKGLQLQKIGDFGAQNCQAFTNVDAK